MYPERVITTFRNFHHKLPWIGRAGGFEFATQKGPFNPAMTIKLLPMNDLSRAPNMTYSEFDAFVDNVRQNVKPGDVVKAVKVNGQFNESDSAVLGKISKLNVDYKHKRIRIYVRDLETNEQFEVYPETIFREDTKMEECKKYVMDYDEFILS